MREMSVQTLQKSKDNKDTLWGVKIPWKAQPTKPYWWRERYLPTAIKENVYS